ncbi:hypothetical protein DFH11DRAFT_1740764 [Phellopilus nigrolimitatus]|nr:hypothetical protein DFH11DRAFT_1740764 [Phellopilus nigrolimitatus]
MPAQRSPFSNKPLVDVPRAHDIDRLALAHTCKSYFNVYEEYRLANLTVLDLTLDARDPTKAHIRQNVVYRKYRTLSHIVYKTKKVERPATGEELRTVIVKGNKLKCITCDVSAVKPEPDEDWKVDAPAGAVLVEKKELGSHIVIEAQTWKVHESKMGFTVADIRDLCTGRYKLKGTYWKRDGESIKLHVSWSSDRKGVLSADVSNLH